jgi:WNK lysine deficient protein kinase
VHRSVWRRESDIRNELDKTREELNQATELALEFEQKCDTLENRARSAEARYRDTMRSLKELEEPKLTMTEEDHTKMMEMSPGERENLVSHILNGKRVLCVCVMRIRFNDSSFSFFLLNE